MSPFMYVVCKAFVINDLYALYMGCPTPALMALAPYCPPLNRRQIMITFYPFIRHIVCVYLPFNEAH